MEKPSTLTVLQAVGNMSEEALKLTYEAMLCTAHHAYKQSAQGKPNHEYQLVYASGEDWKQAFNALSYVNENNGDIRINGSTNLLWMTIQCLSPITSWSREYRERWQYVLNAIASRLDIDAGPAIQAVTNAPKANAVPDPKQAPEHTGLSVNYYQVDVESPTTEGRAPYTAECNDIIEALGMSFAQANIFKEIWRSAAAKHLGKLKAGHDAVYGAEKIQFFALRNFVQIMADSKKNSARS